jgi:hypothetical protein
LVPSNTSLTVISWPRENAYVGGALALGPAARLLEKAVSKRLDRVSGL